jgi:translation initiation factor 3 subunit A
LKLSPDSVKSLYNILEVTFDPLTLCSSIAPLLQTLSSDEGYSPYLALLQRALLSRLLSQLSQVYSTVKINNLLSLVAPLKEAGLAGTYDEEQIEAYIMGCARRGELNIRVDHKAGSVTFVDDAFVAGETVTTAAGRETSIQPSMAELVRTRLCNVATCLHHSLGVLEADGQQSEVLSEEEQAEKFEGLVAVVESERKALQLRRALVARRRELLSELSVRKEKEETSRRAEMSRREKEEDSKRMREEMRRKEQERAKKEIESIRTDEAKKYAQSLVDKGILKANDMDVCILSYA